MTNVHVVYVEMDIVYIIIAYIAAVLCKTCMLQNVSWTSRRKSALLHICPYTFDW